MRMYDLPDSRGHFGPYGGVFVAETLIHALDELKAAYAPHCQLQVSDEEDGWILMTAKL